MSLLLRTCYKQLGTKFKFWLLLIIWWGDLALSWHSLSLQFPVVYMSHLSFFHDLNDIYFPSLWSYCLYSYKKLTLTYQLTIQCNLRIIIANICWQLSASRLLTLPISLLVPFLFCSPPFSFSLFLSWVIFALIILCFSKKIKKFIYLMYC